jgi:hypothetical protein
MRCRAKAAAAAVIMLLTPACTPEEMHAIALGVSQALSETYSPYGTDYYSAYGPTYCDPGYRLELGYDGYGNPVRFCSGPDYEYSELYAAAALEL